MKDPAALLYIDTWKVSTTEMSAIERAYYMDLIIHQFDKGDIPNDIEELANICRVRFSEFEQFKSCWDNGLSKKFLVNEDGRLENEFARETLKKRQKFVKKRSSAGKLSYLSRFLNKHFTINAKQEKYVKENIDLESFDTKDEVLFKKVIDDLLSELKELSPSKSFAYRSMLLSDITEKDYPDANHLKTTQAFADLFQAYLDENDINSKTVSSANGKWIDHIRLMVEVDNRTHGEMIEVYEFLQTSDFWQKVILSTAKLRKQFEKLIIEARSNAKPKQQSNKDQTALRSVLTKHTEGIPLE